MISYMVLFIIDAITCLHNIIIIRPSSFLYFPFSVGPRSCIGKNFGMVRGLSIHTPGNLESVIISTMIYTIDGG